MQRFVNNFVPNRNDSKRDLIRKIVLILSIAILIGSLVYISSYYGESKNNEDRTLELGDIFKGPSATGTYQVSDDYPKGYLEKFYPLYEMNKDIAGWIQIPNTKVDYAVVQTANNEYYDRRDFDKKDNQHGVPFLDWRVDMKKPSTNAIIYSHNMNDGQMFGELMNYKSLAFYKEHPLISFDSVYEEAQYKIAAVIICKANDPEFNYHNFIDAKNDAEMTKFIGQIRERSIINTSVDIKPEDKLLTLSTCDYSFKDANNKNVARFVVIARKVRKGEKSDVDVASAKINPNPVMHPDWYKFIAKQQAAELKKQQEEEAAKNFGPIRTEAAKWFTAAELEKIPNDKLELELARRKEAMAQYLDENELEVLTAEEKVALMKERQDSAKIIEKAISMIESRADLNWMTDNEVITFARELAKVKESKWEALMDEKAAQGATEITLDVTSLKLTVGDERKLIATTIGGSGTIKWETTDHAVAVVQGDGNVVARKKGTTNVTATFSGKVATCKLEVTTEPVEDTILTLNKTAEVAVGKNITLNAGVTPQAIADKGVKWSITGGTKSAVQIEPNGLSCIVTGVQNGKSTELTVTTSDNKTAKCVVTVKEAPAQASITLDKTSLTVEVGKDSAALKATVAPAGTAVTWSVADAGIATVKNGVVHGVSAGKTVITATAGTVKAECVVEVTGGATPPPAAEIKLSNLTVKVGATGTIQVTGLPEGVKLTWKSGNEAIATVDENGNVTGVAVGAINVTATPAGGKAVTCKVTVEAAAEPPVTPPTPPEGGTTDSKQTPPAA